MTETMYIGSSPWDEEGVSVSSDREYFPQMRKECRVFLQQIRRTFGPEPAGAKLVIKRFEHDFGPYLEVLCLYDPRSEEATKYAFECENSEKLAKWDAEALIDLKPKGVPVLGEQHG